MSECINDIFVTALRDHDEYKSITCEIREPTQQQINITNNNDWLMRISDKGIEFNREAFPNWQPDDFTKAIIDLLENAYDLKFVKKIEFEFGSNNIFADIGISNPEEELKKAEEMWESSSKMPFKRYIVFKGGWFYPSGGMEDFLCTLDNLDDCKMLIPSLDACEWLHIYDCEQEKIVLFADKNSDHNETIDIKEVIQGSISQRIFPSENWPNYIRNEN